MRSDILLDAIGSVDEKLVERADKHKPKFIYKVRWVPAIAAMLAVMIGVGVFFRPNVLDLTAKATIFEAKYPEAVRFSEDDDTAYSEFRKYINEKRQYYGYGAELDEFFKSTMAEFLSVDSSQNRVYSPLNVYMALAMLAETTDGNSRQQILDLLGVKDIETLRIQANNIWNANYLNSDRVTSVMATSVWLNEDVEYKNDVFKTLAEIYYTSSFQGEMGSKNYDKVMQNWLNSQTGGLLKDMVPGVETDPDTALLLATTTYLKVGWESEFSPSYTKDNVFHGTNGDKTCAFMNCVDSKGGVLLGEKFTAAKKDLATGSMWFILPDEGVSVNDLLADEEMMTFFASDKKYGYYLKELHLSVPRFDVDSNFSMLEGFMNLGITDCLNPCTADFSPTFVDPTGIFLEDAQHGARVIIDEEGVEAAAITVMTDGWWGIGLPNKYYFTVDRPFIFMITNDDELPLFTGVVNNV
ncbi:MAG: serpin family protein [Ruminococcaceae bacterium]|nr:serpin family protein [Oscillospiraceae bacterium]